MPRTTTVEASEMATLRRVVDSDAPVLPEGWKSSKRVSDGHPLELGAYFLLSAQRKHAC